MKKYFIVFVLIFWTVLGKANEEYYLLKKKYLSGDEFALDNFYNNYKKEELIQMKKILKKFFEEKRDKEAIDYILKNEKIIPKMYYFSKFYDCEETDCSSRLQKNYKYLYDLTKDIEFYSIILSFENILEKNKYNELENFFIKNNSLNAINKKKAENNFIENEFDNPKITVKEKEYTILQKKEINIGNEKREIYLLSNLSDESKKAYLYYKVSKDYLIELEIHTVGYPYNISFIDVNGDDQNEIIVENLIETSDFNNLFIFKIDKNNMEKVFELSKDIDIKKYFDYNNMLDELNIEIKDDFKFKKNISYNLPNLIEDGIINSDYPKTISGIIEDKIIFRILGYQNFEIIFDKNFNYKLKAENKYSTNYEME